MSSKDYLYPDITPQQMRLIEVMRRLHLEHKDYFTAPECPYPQEIERYFRSWFDTPVGHAANQYEYRVEEELMGEDKWDALYREVVQLYASLKNAKPSSGDSSESMAYFRTATGLLDKLVSHQERCLGIKQISEFHQTMVDIMEDVLTEDQRNAVLAKMKAAIKAD